ncbi:hypothetical protein ACLHWY_26040 [Priestia aryabhattai]|uniref:hypothetical protein n=1 Tax=Priestia aryabhattai TaxID=412384 RepID=UPI003983D821
MNKDVIEYVNFSELDVKDPFFDSLTDDYDGFDRWFEKKSLQGEKAYILKGDNLSGFLYLKEENEADDTITPKFEKKRRLKVGTFKIDAHGTVLGQRFIGLILKRMIEECYSESYVTIFEKQKPLISLFERFGFSRWGKNKNGELVYVKSSQVHNDLNKDFPRIQSKDRNKFLLSIEPIYHTRLFPDSKLKTERDHKIEDLSFTNTVEKVYLAGMYGMEKIKPQDLMVIYRKAETGKVAEWNSVATSVCTVLEKKNIRDFNNIEDFIRYCGKGTIFSKSELTRLWNSKRYPHILKMLYNISLPKRIVRHDLIVEGVIDREAYAGFVHLTDKQFEKVIELGEVNESFVIN